MAILFDFAVVRHYLPLVANPMEKVKIKGEDTEPRVISLVTLDQFDALLADPQTIPIVKVLIELAMCTGARISELLGLKWDDVDWEGNSIFIHTSMVGKNKNKTKTRGSQEDVPMHPELAATLKAWRELTPVVEGWIFGSIQTGRPFWGNALQDSHLKQAGERIGIESLGWHNFRHTHRKMADDLGTSIEVQQAMMRHTTPTMTMKYGREKSKLEAVRPANTKIVEMLKNRAVSIIGPLLDPGTC
jgi:integrase